MKSIVTLIATLVAATAFAADAPKAPEVVKPVVAASVPAVTASKPVKAEKKVVKKAEKPVKSAAPVVKDEKAATPAAPASK